VSENSARMDRISPPRGDGVREYCRALWRQRLFPTATALHIGNGGDGQSTGNVGGTTVSGNTVNNSLYNAVGFSTCNNINFQNNTINSPGLNGIVISPNFYPAPTGSASITGNTVNGLSSGMSAYLNLSGGFSATVTGNSWQTGGGGTTPVNGSTYHLICRQSGKAMDNGGSTVDGGQVTQWANQAGNVNQEWKLVDVGSGYFNLVCQRAARYWIIAVPLPTERL